MPTCGTCIRRCRRSHRTPSSDRRDVGSRARGTSVALVAAVAAGGAVGALLRHGVDVTFPVPAVAFPWPTLGINVSGSALLAALGAWPLLQRRPVLVAAAGPGLLGGWTTLSAYADQARRLLAADRPVLALGYLGATLVGCLLGCLVAAALTRRYVGPGAGDRADHGTPP